MGVTLRVYLTWLPPAPLLSAGVTCAAHSEQIQQQPLSQQVLGDTAPEKLVVQSSGRHQSARACTRGDSCSQTHMSNLSCNRRSEEMVQWHCGLR